MRRRKPPLTEDDRQLWQKITQRVDPLHPESRKPVAKLRPTRKKAAEGEPPREPIKSFRIGQKAETASVAQRPAVDDKGAKVSPNMDKRNFQRLLRGQIDIDATLDLHGMTADQAQQRLVPFLQQAHARGARLVLVITGKGKRAHVDEFNRPRAGVLRKALPDWLRAGALSGLVLQVTQAHPKHGGKGAYYVYLRRKR